MGRALDVSRLNQVPAIVGQDGEAPDADSIVGQSAPMQEVYKTIGRVAPQDVTVLILGESGTGKELAARAIYHYSRRSKQPFLAINCAALPEALLESELFGHERGAFTGADQRRIGKFEQVNGGTIFLDEIGDMSPSTQAKALRLLQQQQFERVGGNVTIQTDVRIIAATNRDLETLVTEGKFRQDLYYRLAGFTLRMPPLRERLDDIPHLTDYLLRTLSRELERPIRGITDDARAALQRHQWPGNVRELYSAIRYAIVQSSGEIVTQECLPDVVRNGGVADRITASADAWAGVRQIVQEMLDCGSNDIYRQLGQIVDRVVLDLVLAQCQGNQLQAAERLGISRVTLRSKLKTLRGDSDGE